MSTRRTGRVKYQTPSRQQPGVNSQVHKAVKTAPVEVLEEDERLAEEERWLRSRRWQQQQVPVKQPVLPYTTRYGNTPLPGRPTRQGFSPRPNHAQQPVVRVYYEQTKYTDALMLFGALTLGTSMVLGGDWLYWGKAGQHFIPESWLIFAAMVDLAATITLAAVSIVQLCYHGVEIQKVDRDSYDDRNNGGYDW